MSGKNLAQVLATLESWKVTQKIQSNSQNTIPDLIDIEFQAPKSDFRDRISHLEHHPYKNTIAI